MFRREVGKKGKRNEKIGNRNAIGKKGKWKIENFPVTALLSSGVYRLMGAEAGVEFFGGGSQPPPH